MSDGRDERDRPLRVAHLITRLIVGGAQENTLHTVEDEHRLHGDDVSLITGPGIGPEGTLEPRARPAGFRFTSCRNSVAAFTRCMTGTAHAN